MPLGSSSRSEVKPWLVARAHKKILPAGSLGRMQVNHKQEQSLGAADLFERWLC